VVGRAMEDVELGVVREGGEGVLVGLGGGEVCRQLGGGCRFAGREGGRKVRVGGVG
jgi:hypothetical protein